MSRMPKVWYPSNMSVLKSSSFCAEHDEASAMYVNLRLAVFVFYFRAAKSTL